MDLEPYLPHVTRVVAGVAGLSVLGRVVVSLIVTRGAPPKERPAILRAVGDMFRPWRGGGGPLR